MLVFNRVDKVYQGKAGRLSALAGLSLCVQAGESVALIGPSGSGKSTALLLAAGLLAPDGGEVRIAGEPVGGPRRKTGLILQDFGLLPWKTVFENAALGLRIRGVKRAERRDRTQEILKQVGLAPFAQSYPRELSGGMRQRLALARALALEVDLLLMDEPLSALDLELREALQDLLLGLWHTHGYTQMVVTHAIDEAVLLGQRILVMSARPGYVAAEVANPRAGSPGYRSSADYYAKINEVREALLCQRVLDEALLCQRAPDEAPLHRLLEADEALLYQPETNEVPYGA